MGLCWTPYLGEDVVPVINYNMVGVAQLVRALGCGPGGRGFESPRSPHFLKEVTNIAFVTSFFSTSLSLINPPPYVYPIIRHLGGELWFSSLYM